MKKYRGGCHCGGVRFEVEADLDKTLVCNCSHCEKKGFILSFVENAQFNLLQGEDLLTEYFFNKRSIRHLFCKNCGIQSFAQGVTFPQVAVNVRCLDDVDIYELSPTPFNGKDI